MQFSLPAHRLPDYDDYGAGDDDDDNDDDKTVHCLLIVIPPPDAFHAPAHDMGGDIWQDKWIIHVIGWIDG